MVVVSLLASLFSIDTSLLFVSFHGFIPKTTTYGISLVAACMAMFFLYVKREVRGVGTTKDWRGMSE